MRKDEIIIAIDLPPRFRRPADWQEGTRQEGAGGERGRGLPQNTITVFPSCHQDVAGKETQRRRRGNKRQRRASPRSAKLKKRLSRWQQLRMRKKNHWLLVGLLCDFRAEADANADEGGGETWTFSPGALSGVTSSQQQQQPISTEFIT